MKSGYQGKDAMRSMAEKALGLNTRGGMKSKPSSSPSVQKPSSKKGCAVKKSEGGAMLRTVRSQMERSPAFKTMPVKAATMKKGGSAKNKYDMGGAVEFPSMTSSARPVGTPLTSTQPVAPQIAVQPQAQPQTPTYKKGGRTAKATVKMAIGGAGKVRLGVITKSGKPKKGK